MPRDDEKFTKTWFDRFDRAKKAKKDWEETYEVGRCKDYWKGNQLEEPVDEFGARRVQINKVHSSVQASVPTLYFQTPFVRVQASPALSDTPGQPLGRSIDDKAALLQDTGNTFVRDKSTNFVDSTSMALKEAHWAFGCVRVMYDSVPVENPAAKSLPLKEKENTPEPSKRFGEVLGLSEDPMLIKEERFYVKRIPARQVLCSADQSGTIGELAWVGYWSVSYLEDVKRTKLYKNTGDLKASTTKLREDGENKDRSTESAGDKVLVYHIWDQRAKRHYVFAEGHTKPLLDAPYKRSGPLKFLRLDVDPDEFYPIPPIFQQLHPQDETNDSHEWLRLNRKGTVSRFTYDEDAVEPSEMRKLESGKMGTYIKRKQGTHQVIEPVPQPNYSIVATQTLALAREEFSEVSMQGGEKRGVPQSKTATQARIIDVRGQVQESYDRSTVGAFLASIIEEMIWLAKDKMSLNHWVLLNADVSAAGFLAEAQNISAMWQEITHEDLADATDGVKWSMTVDAASMSPEVEEGEKQDWQESLSLLGNPVLVRLLAASKELRKRTFDLYGVKSARDQELIGAALQQLVQMEMQMASMGGPAPKGLPSPPAAGGAGAPPVPRAPGVSGPGGTEPGGAPAPVGPPPGVSRGAVM